MSDVTVSLGTFLSIGTIASTNRDQPTRSEHSSAVKVDVVRHRVRRCGDCHLASQPEWTPGQV